MPGGRLTHADRQRIEQGLSDHLGYAEIARDLGRPTSTITREVNRNGGPADYRADRAHQATQRRTRRRKPAKQATPATDADHYGRDPEKVMAFEAEFTALLIATGLPKMTSRVLGCLFTTDSGALTAAELTERLGVSAASVSAAVGYLEEQNLIRRERASRSAGRPRRDHYVIDADAWYSATLAGIQANTMLAATARTGADILGTTTPAGARLQDMGEYLESFSAETLKIAEHWRQVLAAKRRNQTYQDQPP